METINALGFVEVLGLVPGIEAADAMLKSARVRLLRQYEVQPGMITVVVEGDLASCQAAVNAGVAAAARVGVVIASHLIARPDTNTETMVLDLIPGAKRGTPAPAEPAGQDLATPDKAEAAPSKASAQPLAKPAEKAAEKEPAKAAKKATPKSGKATAVAKPAAGALAAFELDQLVAFIAQAPKGRTWEEIAGHFPGQAKPLRKALDSCLKSGMLNKAGVYYRKAKEQ